jgi:hypothetical protein
MGLSRDELFAALEEAPRPIVPDLLQEAYQLELHREWSTHKHNPHGYDWHTSFHASSFPGKDQLACGRKAVYELMDPPSTAPLTPFTKAMFDVGLNLEHDWVRRWSAYGVLLSVDVNMEGVDVQTGFRDSEHWLTGASDAILLNREKRKAHCTEVKTTSHEKVLKMIHSNGADVPRSHGKYLRQLGTYIGLAHEQPFTPRVQICQTSGLLMANPFECPGHQQNGDKPHPLLHIGPCIPDWITVGAPDDGTLIYSSREEPLTVASFNVRYDPEFMSMGRAKLAAWQKAFLEERIPEHPREEHKNRGWSVDPCQYCLSPYSLVLKADMSWVMADDLKVGDEIVGYDEEFMPDGKRSAYRRATVEAVPRIVRPRVRIKTNIGYAESSSEHRYLVARSLSRRDTDGSRHKRRCWVEAKDLVVGDEIVQIGAPWIPQYSYNAGWLAGIFDGEGYVAQGYVAFAQVEGLVLDKAKNILDALGFSYSLSVVDRKTDRPCYRVRINGGVYEQMRLLGMIRPTRLLTQSGSVWEGHATWSKSSKHATVEEVEMLDEGEVIAITTSTATLIADGLLSHNCPLKKDVCKPDYTGHTTSLRDSDLIGFSQGIDPTWDYDTKRNAVLARWGLLRQGEPTA